MRNMSLDSGRRKMTKIDFSDCKKCPIRKECRECEIKDLTCEELYEVLKADEETLEVQK